MPRDTRTIPRQESPLPDKCFFGRRCCCRRSNGQGPSLGASGAPLVRRGSTVIEPPRSPNGQVDWQAKPESSSLNASDKAVAAQRAAESGELIPVPDARISYLPPISTPVPVTVALSGDVPKIRRAVDNRDDLAIGTFILGQAQVEYGNCLWAGGCESKQQDASGRLTFVILANSAYLDGTFGLAGLSSPWSNWILWKEYDTDNAPLTLAHELGHQPGLGHILGTGPVQPAPPLDTLTYAGIGVRGFDPQPFHQDSNGNVVMDHGPKVATVNSDLMSYMRPEWTSPTTWRRMLAPLCKDAAACGGRATPLLVQTPNVSSVTGSSAASNMTRQVVYGFVSGGVATIIGVTSMPAWYAQSLATGATSGKITLASSSGKTLAVGSLTRSVVADGSSSIVPFFANLPNVTGIASVKATSAAGKAIGSLVSSRHAPTVRFTALPAKVTAAATAVMRYTALDADKQSVRVVIWARRGTGAWQPIAIGTPTGVASAVARKLGVKGGIQFKIQATDGLRSTTVVSRTINVV